MPREWIECLPRWKGLGSERNRLAPLCGRSEWKGGSDRPMMFDMLPKVAWVDGKAVYWVWIARSETRKDHYVIEDDLAADTEDSPVRDITMIYWEAPR